MVDAFFKLPLLVTGPIIVGFLCTYSVVGMLLVRRYAIPRMKYNENDSNYGSGMVQAIMVFYGLAVALIAMNVWQTYTNVSQVISQEATAIAGLYRDVSGYPDPIRGQLQQGVRDYLDYTIHQAWPMQQKGQVPTGGVEVMDHFQRNLISFEPATEGQKILHAETLHAYNTLIQTRRMRLDAVGTQLPGILWFVIFVGAMISLCAAFFFKLEDPRVHGAHVVLLATFMGLVIFMIFALDRPFIGDLGLRPDSYQLIYDQLMKK
jgi:hypothetical protein